MNYTVSDYLKDIQKELRGGKAGEHAYRPALKSLVESLKKGILATNEPKREECGAPDFIIQTGVGNVPLGYIECKDIGVSLDAVEKSDQMERYLSSLANLILTDYLEFRYYVQGEQRMTVQLATIDNKGKIKKTEKGDAELLRLFDIFLQAKWPSIETSKELARRMAKLAQLIRDTIINVFEHESEKRTLHQQMEGFRDVLISDLTEAQFADMYAQTICYGLFAAICNLPVKDRVNFNREHAAYDLPKTNPFLRSMFKHIAGPDLDERIT